MEKTSWKYIISARDDGTFSYTEIGERGIVKRPSENDATARELIETAKGLVRRLGVKEVKLEIRDTI